MRRIVVLAVAMVFVTCAATAFAQQQVKERNLIKIIQKSIEQHPGTMKEKDKLRGDIAQVKTFQSMADYIKEHSAKARGQSIRTQSVK